MARLILVALVSLVFVLPSSSNEKMDKVNFEVFPRYFVKNTVKLEKNPAFFVLQDKKGFDEVFGIGFVMGKKPKLVDANLFEKHLIVATVHSGNKLWTYDVEGVRIEKKQLIVQYKATAGKEGGAMFNSTLVVSAPRGEYNEVVFIENGKEVGKHAVK